MKSLIMLVRRNTKLFFKDKGMFFTSLITPIILLVLYITFLGNVFRDTFSMTFPKDFNVSEKLINGCVGGQLFSSLLAVCCITVAFCSNMLMVQDKVTGARYDLTITPVKKFTLAFGYYISTALTTLIICLIAAAASFIYLANVGWYMSAADIMLIILDVFLLVMFGTALSSIINFFLTSQGQMSAVGTIISAGYGFICGAYMPISQFGGGLQKVLSFLPGSYGTSLIRNHAMRGVFNEMVLQHFPSQVIEGIKDSIDCNLYFFGDRVSIGAMYAILAGAVAVLLILYVIINALKIRSR